MPWLRKGVSMGGSSRWCMMKTHICVAVHTQTLNLISDSWLRVTFSTIACAIHAFDLTSHILEKVLGQGFAG